MSSVPEQTVTITQSLFDQLMKDSEWLGCLEAAGVDNWQGIDEAYRMFNEDTEEDE